MKKLMSLTVTLLLTVTLALTTAAQDYTRWELPPGATLRLGKGNIYEIVYSPDGMLLAVASSIGVWLYDTTTYQEISLLIGHTDPVWRIHFSPDGELLASSGGSTVCLWDVNAGQLGHTLAGHPADYFGSADFSLDGQTLAGWGDWTVYLWDVNTGQLRNTLYRAESLDGVSQEEAEDGPGDDVRNVRFSPDRQVLAGGIYETVRLWDVNTGKTIHTLSGHDGPITLVRFSPDGQLLASSGRWDDTIRLWDVNTGKLQYTLAGHLYDVAFSPDGQLLASGSGDGTVLLWSVSPPATGGIKK